MKTITIKTITRTYHNFGSHAEQALAYTLTNEMRQHDKVPYDKGSDIPEHHMSVKSARFTLMSGNLSTSNTFDGMVNEFFEKVASTQFAYVTQDMRCFVMDKTEFREFVNLFCTMDRESSAHGGALKVRMKSESQEVLKWLSMGV